MTEPGNTPDGAIVPFVRGDVGVRYNQDVKERAFVLWATVAGEDAAAVARMLASEADEGEVTPTRQAIWRWSRDEDWASQAAGVWRGDATREKMLYDLRRAMVSNAMLGEIRKRDVLTGAYDDNPMVGALHLKASELTGRTVERVIAALKMPEPPAEVVDESALSREEREALARKRMTERRQEGT